MYKYPEDLQENYTQHFAAFKVVVIKCCANVEWSALGNEKGELGQLA